ncbi:HD domain-containing protein [Sphaerisporangium sp. TRM90804]|uniref:HD domain-containing protein n=1 Tax=Sphaerisporangium sp. TRM90804 TaxID=3031113 RepID=UPI002449DE15|nr:HD domain-containing protein [Sphaerisporangium sp. TRM90804]MDH2427966.1 HD domain-containing protein [Sphaerisporangium sp. TRM90804]
MLVEVAGVRAPVGKSAEAARTVCAEYADDALYHHSARSYFFGAAWAQARGLDFDRELLFVAAMLHDLALTPPFDSHTLAFEEAGGHLARVFTAGLGWPAERRDRAAELIVLHMRDDIAPEVDLESRLLQVGTSADVSGTGLEAFDPSFAATLVEAYPRLGFGESFVRLFQDQAARKPSCAAASVLAAAGWGERTANHPLDQG